MKYLVWSFWSGLSGALVGVVVDEGVHHPLAHAIVLIGLVMLMVNSFAMGFLAGKFE